MQVSERLPSSIELSIFYTQFLFRSSDRFGSIFRFKKKITAFLSLCCFRWLFCDVFPCDSSYAHREEIYFPREANWNTDTRSKLNNQFDTDWCKGWWKLPLQWVFSSTFVSARMQSILSHTRGSFSLRRSIIIGVSMKSFPGSSFRNGRHRSFTVICHRSFHRKTPSIKGFFNKKWDDSYLDLADAFHFFVIFHLSEDLLRWAHGGLDV